MLILLPFVYFFLSFLYCCNGAEQMAEESESEKIKRMRKRESEKEKANAKTKWYWEEKVSECVGGKIELEKHSYI